MIYALLLGSRPGSQPLELASRFILSVRRFEGAVFYIEDRSRSLVTFELPAFLAWGVDHPPPLSIASARSAGLLQRNLFWPYLFWPYLFRLYSVCACQ